MAQIARNTVGGHYSATAEWVFKIWGDSGESDWPKDLYLNKET